MFPDRRERPRDPRTAYNSPGLSQPLGESRSYLTQAASLLSPPGVVQSSFPTVRGRDDFHVCSSARSSSLYRERLNIFQPHQRSRSVSASRRSKNVRKRRMWEHTFVCLASKVQSSVPGPIDRGRLMQAGLGEKLLSFVDSDDAEMLHEDLLQAFPKLREAGGYELLRTCDRNARYIDVIPPPPSGYDVTYLKSVAGQAKIYVRPLQKDLDLTPTGKVDTGFCPHETCRGCGSSLPLSQLKNHIESCPDVKDEDSVSTPTPPSSPCSPAFSPITPKSNASQGYESAGQTNQRRESYRRAEQSFDDDNDDFMFPDTDVTNRPILQNREEADLEVTEEIMVSRAIRESTQSTSAPEVIDLSDADCLPESLNDVINHLKLNVTQETHEYNVRRDEVFSDMMREAKKRSFSPYKRVKTYFVGEQGNDTGGLTRELWCLFARHVQHNLCEGHENCKVIRHDASKLQEGVYRRVGVLMGVSLIQGGSGYPFFAPSTFSYLSGTDVCSILVGCDEIPDIEVKKTLQEIRSASDDNALQEIASNVCDVLISCGYTKPIALLKHEDIPTVIECVSLHSAILKVKAELDEIGKGLADAGVLQMLQKYPHFFRSLFVYEECVLTAEKMITLLEKRTFSENGSSQLVKEKTTYIHFCDLLEELEGGIEMEGERIVTLGDCLSFFTGAQRIPPTGFIQACTLNFSDSNVYPTASTCALILTLPTLYHNSYSCFKEKMLFAFCNHGGFGLC